jgi:hypothetical protein
MILEHSKLSSNSDCIGSEASRLKAEDGSEDYEDIRTSELQNSKPIKNACKVTVNLAKHISLNVKEPSGIETTYYVENEVTVPIEQCKIRGMREGKAAKRRVQGTSLLSLEQVITVFKDWAYAVVTAYPDGHGTIWERKEGDD